MVFAHPPAIEQAARLADLAPGDLSRVFFTTGGSEAVESAWKLAMQYFTAIGQPGRRKVISRHLAYDGTTLGALSLTGVPAYRNTFEPLVPGAVKAVSTNRYRCSLCAGSAACTLGCADDIATRIELEGPAVAGVILEPLQNAGGAFVPAPGYWTRVREICDHYGVLLISDEVICAFGRLGAMFGAERYGYQPDMVTFAKGVTSGYAPLGGVIVSDRVAAPFLADPHRTFLHGITFGGHPVSCAVALANLDVLEREQIVAEVAERAGRFEASLRSLTDIDIVGDIRGDGYFWAVELVREQTSKQSFTPAESEWLLRGMLSERLIELGLLCRTDDRGDPVIILAPPLIAGDDEFDEITTTVRTVLGEASVTIQSGKS